MFDVFRENLEWKKMSDFPIIDLRKKSFYFKKKIKNIHDNGEILDINFPSRRFQSYFFDSYVFRKKVTERVTWGGI